MGCEADHVRDHDDPMSGLSAREIAPGLWLWQVAQAGASGGQVASLYAECPKHVVLVDPVLPSTGTVDHERFLGHLDRDLDRVGRPLAVVLTSDHGRSAAFLERRYRATTYRQRTQDDVPGLGTIVLGEHRPTERIVTVPAHRVVFCGDIVTGDGRGRLRWGSDGGAPETVRRVRVALVRRLREFAPAAVLVAHGESLIGPSQSALDALLRDVEQGFV